MARLLLAIVAVGASAAMCWSVMDPPLLSSGLWQALIFGVVSIAAIVAMRLPADRTLWWLAMIWFATVVVLDVAVLSSPTGHYTLRVPGRLTIVDQAATVVYLSMTVAWFAVAVVPYVVLGRPTDRAPSLKKLAAIGVTLCLMVPNISVLFGSDRSKAWAKLDADRDERFERQVFALSPTKLERLLNDDRIEFNQPRIRSNILSQLKYKGTTADLPALRRLLHHSDAEVRHAAIEGIRRMTPPDVPSLIEALGNSDPEVVLRAVHALESLGPAAKDALPTIDKLLADPDLPEKARLVGSLRYARKRIAP